MTATAQNVKIWFLRKRGNHISIECCHENPEEFSGYVRVMPEISGPRDITDELIEQMRLELDTEEMIEQMEQELRMAN